MNDQAIVNGSRAVARILSVRHPDLTFVPTPLLKRPREKNPMSRDGEVTPRDLNERSEP